MSHQMHLRLHYAHYAHRCIMCAVIILHFAALMRDAATTKHTLLVLGYCDALLATKKSCFMLRFYV